ncbi:MAG: GTP 3',8-cyclase MoaA [Desulfuromonas sp.]|nr:MAG: GTP 3',8-cyclase MoaA [Desulfuromonas sp.]
MRLVDPYQRTINYLRLSITDRCNLRCCYCQPHDPAPKRNRLLTDKEIVFLAKQAIALGVEKIRVTGGEPLVRPGVIALLNDLRALDGLKHLVLTTNGVLLTRHADELVSAGLSRINVSIDSLRQNRFYEITRGGSLVDWWRGVDAAEKAGLAVKLNVVVMAGVNDDEVVDFVRFGSQRGWTVRFIEYMPFAGEAYQPLDEQVLRDRLDQAGFALTPVSGSQIAGPAREYAVAGTMGKVGFISARSCPFCHDCNRLRITANGEGRGCLFSSEGIDLRPALERFDGVVLRTQLVRLAAQKPQQYRALPQDGQVEMSAVGG